MRNRIVTQPELDLNPPSLKITQEFYAKYDRISRLLDENPAILGLVHGDLASMAEMMEEGEGRARYASDTVLRLCVCQAVEGLSLRETTIRVDTCGALRRFIRVDGGSMMDYSTFCRLRNAITPETWRKINQTLARYAVAEEAISAESLRLDTTAVETNIHWPTDSSLLVDVFEVVKRDLDRARELGVELLKGRRFHDHSVRQLGLRIIRKGGRRGAAAKELKPLYKRLIRQIEEILSVAGSVAACLHNPVACSGVRDEALAARLTEFQTLGAQVISQARRRVIHEESVPNDEKLFSVFEPHTELLKRGKAGKPIEFGHMIQIQQVKEKFITDYGVYEKKPVEPTLLETALASHRALFGVDPICLAADKGYFEQVTVDALEQRIETVSIAKKGKRTQAQLDREHDPVFRHAQRFRAGVEGTISYLKRVLGLSRCFTKGWTHYQSTIGANIFTHNLLILTRC
jgi:IS5 family transposase